MRIVKEISDPKNIQNDEVKDLFVDSPKGDVKKKKLNKKEDEHESLVAKKTRRRRKSTKAEAPVETPVAETEEAPKAE